MVAEFGGELKTAVAPNLSVGGRIGGMIGVGLSFDAGAEARSFVGLPLLAKADLKPFDGDTRALFGLGAGFTLLSAAGTATTISGTSLDTAAWAVTGAIPTLMPEVGVDIKRLRLAVHYNLMLGSGAAVRAAVSASPTGATATVDDNVPGLNGLQLQIGIRFGVPTSSIPQLPPPPGDVESTI